ncbi:PRA1 family protein [Toxoplasma gondii TgCatPRC2]|uniref:PRA1 family protein n=1 Tax=Toxoplasma gondii TgCatPRC2 TaxID=1130821 RepID=A0A151HF95_TOXGO|nr:PRA1 family protein [Toxoplasma gondii TgCatPRC2]
MLDPTDSMDDFYNDTSTPGVPPPPARPSLLPATSASVGALSPAAPALSGSSGKGESNPVSVTATQYGNPRLDSEGRREANSHFRAENSLPVGPNTPGPLPVGGISGNGSQNRTMDSRTIRAGFGNQEARRPKLEGVLGGTLDGSGNSLGGQKLRGQFAVSQLHGVFLSLQRALLSKAVSWRDFLHLPSLQKPQTGAVAVDRIERNLRYFHMNYVIICSALTLVAALLNPVVLLVCGLCAGASFLAGLKGDTLQLGDTVVPVKTFRVLCLLVGGLVVLLVAGNVVVSLLIGFAVLVLLHASLHVGVSYEQIAQRAAGDAEFDV